MAQKYSVLIVDDQKNWRELLTEILEDQFDTYYVNDYIDAIDAIDNQEPPFHVVVTDMRLTDQEVGNEDGLKLVEHLNQRGDGTKAIVVTGYATIDSAKRAIKNLDVYDYLEKGSSGGPEINAVELRRKVLAAAKDAEEFRPKGITDLNHNILLIEHDPDWRKRLGEALEKDGYTVETLLDFSNLESQLKALKRDFALILISELLYSDALLRSLNQLFPNGKIVIITLKEISSILDALREFPVEAFSLSQKKFNTNSFSNFIHKILSRGATKYITWQIYPQGQSNQFNIYKDKIVKGILYNMDLTIHDSPENDATMILLWPSEEKNRKIQLHLFIHAEQMTLDLGTEIYWEVSPSIVRPNTISFPVIPQQAGEKQLTIELNQNHRFLGRIVVKLRIIDEASSK